MRTGFFQGSGGAIFEMDVPDPDLFPHRHEDFAQKLAKGDLVELDPAEVVKVWVNPADEAQGYRWEKTTPAEAPAKPARRTKQQPDDEG